MRNFPHWGFSRPTDNNFAQVGWTLPKCCDVTIELEGDDSATGASRICGNYSVGEPIDIATMLRDWTDDEGSEREAHRLYTIASVVTKDALPYV